MGGPAPGGSFAPRDRDVLIRDSRVHCSWPAGLGSGLCQPGAVAANQPAGKPLVRPLGRDQRLLVQYLADGAEARGPLAFAIGELLAAGDCGWLLIGCSARGRAYFWSISPLALFRRVRRGSGVQAVQVLWLSVWLSAVGCSNNIQSSSNMIRP